MRTEHFGWRDIGPHTAYKMLGCFTEDRMEVGIVRLAANASFAQNEKGRSLLFVLSGNARINGEPAGPWSAVEVPPGITAECETPGVRTYSRYGCPRDALTVASAREFASTVPVVVVGGGIVGLCTSLMLSRHGVRSTVFERHRGTYMHPRGRNVNPRSMEIFREAGIANRVRAVGARLAASLGLFRGETLRAAIEPLPRRPNGEMSGEPRPYGFDFAAIGPELPSRGTQDLIEPVVLEAARAGIGDVVFNAEVTAIEDDGAGVTATVLDRTANATRVVRAAYAVAADGAGSFVRNCMEVPRSGPGVVGYAINVLFEADLGEFVRGREFNLCIVNADRPHGDGLFASIDNRNRWVHHIFYYPARGERASDFTPEKCAAVVRQAIGVDSIDVRIVSVLPWQPTVLVADGFRHGRIFLAGDAAHQMTPMGGQGANSGIADAHNLAWKMALALRAPRYAAILESYDAERRPITTQAAEESAEWFGAGG